MITEKNQSIVEQVRLWGNMISDAVLDPDALLFDDPECQGFIGFRLESNCAVVIGDPICPREEWGNLVPKFQEYCRKNGWPVIYLIVSQAFKDWSLGNICKASIEFGEELFINPQELGLNGQHKGRHLRYKLRRAKNEGVFVREYTSEDPHKETEMEYVKDQWLKNRQGFQIYISPIYLFSYRHGKRWFYAEHNGHIVAVLLLNELRDRGGWIVNRYMTLSEVPVGTVEILLATAIETLANEGCEFLSFGPVEGEHLGKMEGLSFLFTLMAQGAFKLIYRFFNMGGRKGFWERFHPKSKYCYILFDRANLGLKEIKAIIKAMKVEFRKQK
jgi:lysylphosphatidylglycerol synthetase-like protein (DUF2156 family)